MVGARIAVHAAVFAAAIGVERPVKRKIGGIDAIDDRARVVVDDFGGDLAGRRDPSGTRCFMIEEFAQYVQSSNDAVSRQFWSIHGRSERFTNGDQPGLGTIPV